MKFFILFITIINVFALNFDEEWRTVLHLNNKNFGKYNSSFYISYPFVNAKNELNQDLELIKEKNKNFICNFPYRYIFLKKYYNLPSFDLDKCKKLQTFIKSFKDEKKLGLVFSSEYSSSTESSFGHVMLILINNKSFINSDVIHFAAKAKKEGFFKYSYDGLAGNFDAFYIREKLFKKIYLYNILQQRTMFIYYLNTNNIQFNNFLLHLYELKKFKAKYYFRDFNCASATLDLLKIIYPSINYNKLVVFPINDIEKIKNKTSNIKILIPLNKQIILLLNKMNKQDKLLLNQVINNKYKGSLDILPNIVKETLNKLYEYKFRKYHYIYGNYEQIKKLKFQTIMLDKNKIVKPLDKPLPSKIALYMNSNNNLEIDIRPFLISEQDYQKNLTDEKHYEVFTSKLEFKQNQVYLNEFDIFTSKSMAKIYYPYIVPISKKSSMGFNRKNIKNKLTFNCEFGVGQSFQHGILFNYFLLFGFDYGAYNSIYLKPEINVIYYYKNLKFYSINNIKIFDHNYYSNIEGITYKYNNISLSMEYKNTKKDNIYKLGIYYDF